MGDTKRGREREGRKKREQLRERLVQRAVETRETDDELPAFDDFEFDPDE